MGGPDCRKGEIRVAVECGDASTYHYGMAKNVIRNRLILTVLLLFAACMALSMGGVLVLFQSSLLANERMQMVSALRTIRVFLELEIPGDWENVSGQLHKGSFDISGDIYLPFRISPYLPPGSWVEFHSGRLPESLKPVPYEIKGLENVIRLFEPKPGRPSPAKVPRGAGLQGAGPAGAVPPPAPSSRLAAGGALAEESVFLITGGMATKLYAFDGSETGWISFTSDRSGPSPMDSAYIAFFLGANGLLAILTLGLLYVIVFRLSSPIERLAASKTAAERLSRTDPLTGLMNRRGFEAALESAPRPGKALGSALALIDIDDFKEVNDRHGHDCGDAVLAQFAETIRSSARAADLACRWGGEEFLVYFPEITRSDAVEVLERVRAAIASREYGAHGEKLRVTATIGAVIDVGAAGLQDSVRRADEALYRGKRSGKNRVVLSGP